MNFYANILESKQPVIGDNYFYQTKEEIIEWLKNMRIENYTINNDLTIDVDGLVDLTFKYLKKIPVKFNKIRGKFGCGYNQLTSLKGSPEIVGSGDNGGFGCNNNQLNSLKYCPKIINGNFYCNSNELISLIDLPIIKGNYRVGISNNPIKTLKGLKNISANLLIGLLKFYSNLDWKDIEWDKVKNINEIIDNLYKNIEKRSDIELNEEALQRMEEAGAY